MVQKQGEYLTT